MMGSIGADHPQVAYGFGADAGGVGGLVFGC